MGNCHAVDPVCATVEHPNGKVEKLYFSSSAQQLMLQYPGHYVALVSPPPTPIADCPAHVKRKLKLLPPGTMLNIGSCYRLVSFEDVLSEMSDKGAITHQVHRKRSSHSGTTVSKHQPSPIQSTQVLMEQSDVRRSAVKQINQLRTMLSKSFASQKENIAETLTSPAAPAPLNYPSMQSPLQSLHPVYRGGAWRPSLQSIAERGR
ncbi:uncharacterized protein [Physcomitrium patens]|uniref:DUF4228 domain-containing protein n=1 Tax=Physcomitrium patens TaxID=3218 RepID=A0A2K1JBN6_PHYPA|nr:uncharacterized protein LOC112292400 [Physcomitrium patens]PNR38945.1 hypothetical protein PHYPA_019223 [Physcomitrium patens]|eukprot:XP_024396601.1 uncharacterized protein LOC112292400 [Physcomitrella patens]